MRSPAIIRQPLLTQQRSREDNNCDLSDIDMKKLLSVILSLVLLLSMNVTAYAGTISGSESGCEYTVHIPADCSIEYGNTGLQSIGKVSVTSTNWSAFTSNHKAVQVTITYDPYLKSVDVDEGIWYRAGFHVDLDGRLVDDTEWSCQGNIEMEYFIHVSNWDLARMGTTYTTTITYNISLVGTYW